MWRLQQISLKKLDEDERRMEIVRTQKLELKRQVSRLHKAKH